jgi:hypothetical protein
MRAGQFLATGLCGVLGSIAAMSCEDVQRDPAADGMAGFRESPDVLASAVRTKHDERVDALLASRGGTACLVACWTAAGLGCGAVSGVCTATTVITMGGTCIPCTSAVVAACGAAGEGAQGCVERLCSP